MKYDVYFTDDARADLLQIADYIAQDNIERAITLVYELETRIEKTLSIFPHSGKIYKNATYSFPLNGRIVFYEVDESAKSVFVMNVTGATTDWKNNID